MDIFHDENQTPAVAASEVVDEAVDEAAVRKPKAGARPDTRAGITIDSEVSRVLGRDVRGGDRTVNIVRGSKSEEQKF